MHFNAMQLAHEKSTENGEPFDVTKVRKPFFKRKPHAKSDDVADHVSTGGRLYSVMHYLSVDQLGYNKCVFKSQEGQEGVVGPSVSHGPTFYSHSHIVMSNELN